MTQLLEFKNLKELMAHLSDEKVCREYMEQMRWAGSPFCPFCNATKPYKLGDGKSYRCREKTCRKDFTVTTKTIFENSKLKLSTWLAAIYILTGHKKGISSCQLARDLGITQKSSWFILHRVRYIMNEPQPEPLKNTVEADETYVGGTFANMNKERRKKYQEQGIDNKTPVMGLLERDGKAKLTVIGQNTLKDVVRNNVDKSATIYTDSHSGYMGLGDEFAGHDAVNHSLQEYKRGLTHTNSVEGFFSLFKRTVYGTYHQVSAKHLQQYCYETAYRYNTRKIKDADRFRMTISNVEGRLKYKTLTQK